MKAKTPVNLSTVVDVICEQNGIVDQDSITISSRLNEDLGLDSLDTTELAMALEERFGITINDDDIDKVITVGEVVALLEKLTAGPKQ